MNEGATASSTAADGPDKKGPPPKKTPNDYIFGKVIGEGSFSSVSIWERDLSSSCKKILHPHDNGICAYVTDA